MKLFVVREKVTGKIQGIFWASKESNLCWPVDEMADPALFEAAEITEAGGLWHAATLDQQPVPPRRSDFALGSKGDEEYADAVEAAWPPPFACISEHLIPFFFHPEEMDWREIEWFQD